MSGEKLYTAWMTSTIDGHDHAITDEEFAAHRPEPEAICGTVIMLAPLTVPNGPHCLRCVTFLRARATLRDFDQRERHRHRRRHWWARFLHAPADTLVSPAGVSAGLHRGGAAL
jgi:hypothetical protein